MGSSVHIVTVDYNSDSVLGRLIRPLVRELFWSYSSFPVPDKRNYFFPYLQIERNFLAEKTAGFFTHRDDGRAEKVALWKMADEELGIRLVSSRKYADILREPKALVTHPIDLKKFTPLAGASGRSVGRVGTTGFIYPHGRKGEALMSKLLASPVLYGRFKFVAAGKGWPCDTRLYPWKELQEFYRSLHIYVCTSVIEGFGCGPLEALACGVPVVVPKDVGVFDELPGPGIYRYTAGDLGGLVEGIEAAAICQSGPEEIRQQVLGYTEEAWVRGNREILNEQ